MKQDELITVKELEALEFLDQKATASPWDATPCGMPGSPFCSVKSQKRKVGTTASYDYANRESVCECNNEYDAWLIANNRRLLKKLLNTIRHAQTVGLVLLIGEDVTV